MDYKNYEYKSVLAPLIRDFINEKREMGFLYNKMAYDLHRLDNYWANNHYVNVAFTQEQLDHWICALHEEGKAGHRARIHAVRQFSIYLNSLGYDSYIPIEKITKRYPKVHILSKSELMELFHVVDTYTPRSIARSDYRMANEYPIMFRLLYCCGMRNNEVCSLKPCNINFDTGTITILDGKGHKDRLIYMPDDLKKLVSRYYDVLRDTLGSEPIWLFPGRIPDKHIGKEHLDRVFAKFWNQTIASKSCDKKPTPHCLRHTFVVDRINSWAMNGVDVNHMMEYLSKYLGHKGREESFYYYHLVQEAFELIHKQDQQANKVIPEVKRR